MFKNAQSKYAEGVVKELLFKYCVHIEPFELNGSTTDGFFVWQLQYRIFCKHTRENKMLTIKNFSINESYEWAGGQVG